MGGCQFIYSTENLAVERVCEYNAPFLLWGSVGAVRAEKIHREGMKDWSFKGMNDFHLHVGEYFPNTSISKRYRLYAPVVLPLLQRDHMARTLPDGKSTCCVMFLQTTVERVVEWMNHSIRIRELTHPPIHAGIPISRGHLLLSLNGL